MSVATQDPKPRRIYLSDEDYQRIENAAYWEGCSDPSEFVARVLRRHISQREEERGHTYARAAWKTRGRPRQVNQDQTDDS